MLGFKFICFFHYPVGWPVWPGYSSSGFPYLFIYFYPCYVLFPLSLVCWGGFNFCSGWPFQAVFFNGWEVWWFVFAGLGINDFVLLVNSCNHFFHYIFNTMWWAFRECNLNDVNGYFSPCPFNCSLGLDTTGILFNPLYSLLFLVCLVYWLVFFLAANLGVLDGCLGVLYCLLMGCCMVWNSSCLALCHSYGFSGFLLGKITLSPVYPRIMLLFGNTSFLEVFYSHSTTLLYFSYLISHPFLEFWFFAGGYTKLAVMSSMVLFSLYFFPYYFWVPILIHRSMFLGSFILLISSNFKPLGFLVSFDFCSSLSFSGLEVYLSTVIFSLSSPFV